MTMRYKNPDIPLAGRVLVVNDNATKRHEIASAVRNLGHIAVLAVDGREALAKLDEESFDLILLVLMMPEVDGYQVLEAIKANEKFSWIPVIVISMSDRIDNVVRVIELGATDCLPAGYNSALLDIRVTTCLERKWRREQEYEYLLRTKNLINVATRVQAGENNLVRLQLDELTSHDDSLGDLARVFSGMVKQIHARERKLRRLVHTLQSAFLLIAAGATLGIAVPLSRMASTIESHPFGIALYVNSLVAILGIGITITRRKLPALTRELVHFLLIWGLLTAGIFVAIFWIAENISGAALSVTLVCEGFIVFAIASVLKLEPATPRRLAGLAIGFLGIVTLIVTSSNTNLGEGSWMWLIIALLIPLLFALEDLLIAGRMPENEDLLGLLGLVALVAALMLLPATWLFQDFIALDLNFDRFELLLVLLALKSIVGTYLYMKLMSTSGVIFGSQVGYVKAFAGIVWSILLLNEALPLVAWLSFGIILSGLFLVESQHQKLDEQVKQVPAYDNKEALIS